MRRWLSLAALVAAFALASRFGWWTVPIVAALWGFLRPAVKAPAATAAVAAALAWGLWLLFDWQQSRGGMGVLTARLADLMSLPPVGLIVVTLVLGALLAWSAAALAGGVADLLRSRSGGSR